MNKPTHSRDGFSRDRMCVELELGNFDNPFTLADAIIEGTSLMIASGVEANDVKVVLNSRSVTLVGWRPMTTLELASVEMDALREMQEKQVRAAAKKYLSPYATNTSYSSSYGSYRYDPVNRAYATFDQYGNKINITKEN